MRRVNIANINSPTYWDYHQTATDFGLRQQKYLKLANSWLKKVDPDYPFTIVELGCGLSPFLSKAKKFKKRIGIDYSPITVGDARVLYKDVQYLEGNVLDTPLKTNEADVVVCGEVIEHLENPMELLAEMWRVCQWGGLMILSTPILEFNDAEHLWEFDEGFFKKEGFDTEVVHSERFPGRSYIFAWKLKEPPALTHGYIQTA